MRTDATRLIECELFLDGDVHAEVQERVGRFRGVIPVSGARGIFEQGVIFRVPERHRHDQRFDTFERSVFAAPPPGTEE